MKIKTIKINTFTDESGQDTNGKFFVVCTVLFDNSKSYEIEKILLKVEESSKKTSKWYKSNDTKRKLYVENLINSHVLNKMHIYYSSYSNKSDYSKLVGSHIAKAIINYVDDKDYKAKIFIDKTNKRTINEIKREIKKYRIRYQKIRGLSEEASSFIRLADSCCGLIRDVGKKSSAELYRRFLSITHEI